MTQNSIWILDSDPNCVALYHQTLGLQYPLAVFSDFEKFAETFHASPTGPKLLIADPENARGSMSEFFKAFTGPGSSKQLPETIIVSRLDDIELIRFFLKTGVRDYILKPLRPNELVAKAERTLLALESRFQPILRNEFDGVQINDLTFREHQILTVLLNMDRRTANRDELHNAVWKNMSVNRKTLDVHLFNLRRKLRNYGYDILCRGKEFSLEKVSAS
jgi:DNA-binding response OmpR family regulator